MTNPYVSLFNRYRQKGLLIDTNILLLWMVGTLNPDRIGRFKRTQQFSLQDFEQLLDLVNYFKTIATTPHVLTEVYNLMSQLSSPEREHGLAVLARGVESVLDEQYLPSRALAKLEPFTRFGLTDCGIMEVARGKYLVLTDDFKLFQYLGSLNIDAVNFNHLRLSLPHLY